MRKDMAKVIVERPRVGGKTQKNGRPPRDMEDLPRRQSMRRKHHDRKELNENLNPLERYLESKVGRKWDNVFSDICKNLKLDTAIQKHVRDHLKQMVESRALPGKKPGELLQGSGYGAGRWELSHRALYVDAKGFLRQYFRDMSWKKKRKKHIPAERSKPYVMSEAEFREILLEDALKKAAKAK